MTTTYPTEHRKSNYRKVFEAALRLPISEQRRLSDELAKMVEVCLIAPAYSEKTIHAGQQLADEVRAELAAQASQESLDDMMKRLRGRE